VSDTSDEIRETALLFWRRHGSDALESARKLAKDMLASDKPSEAEYWTRVAAELELIGNANAPRAFPDA